jgi:hypothetical protein
MSIILPDFGGRECIEASFCGFIPARDYGQEERLPSADRPLTAEYKRSGKKVFVRLLLPFPYDEDGDIHIHLDFYAQTQKRLLAPNSDVKSILDRLDHFIGKKILLNLEGTFRTSIAALPHFVRPLLHEYSAGDIHVRLTGGTLTVRGAPIQTISWRLTDASATDRVSLTLGSRTEAVLSESYLVDGLDTLERTFKAFVTSKEKQNG